MIVIQASGNGVLRRVVIEVVMVVAIAGDPKAGKWLVVVVVVVVQIQLSQAVQSELAGHDAQSAQYAKVGQLVRMDHFVQLVHSVRAERLDSMDQTPDAHSVKAGELDSTPHEQVAHSVIAAQLDSVGHYVRVAHSVMAEQLELELRREQAALGVEAG